ncbi:hypothetical protein B566_EDAN002889 [Ephemera danica]|nr:hypothetical protein B566_EDAN002889 [Ephemera danica]
MAGLSEVCAHVAAVLFWVEFAIRKFGDEGCSTSNPNAWLPPTLVKVPYLQVRDVNFDTPRARQKKLEQGCVTTIVTPPGQERNMEPTATELQDFVDELYSILPTSATLKEQPKYSSKLAEINKPNYPQSLSLFEEASAVEQATRKQSHSKMWYHQRTGRVSASVMKLVCHTDPHSPSISLVKQICYPIASKFKSEATSYGSLNERFYIACEYPYIGASPDSIVECDCCGKVYTEKDLHIEYIAPDSSFQSYIQKKAETVFKLVLLPELISKFYTRHAELDLKLKDSSNLQKGHCYCGNPNNALFSPPAARGRKGVD